ncbi:MAG: hypothetical protein A2Y57_03665 [Candidatus Woykebacteria bacterium RBG_13_40_7b]|uniref:LytR/CpsA/Psr regulator C-terminal domain-containing protein n=1 Tax=Candidatus Woykebacteria bacterium RBG_13_40_7b TaxID=1802594 RepID=A0A1G1W6S4_9BACT|nr:MAG: hypothetical protein A2Y57_03665 [Candidatus Woykebacteria bacterium RBG_13_40_7b]
MPAQRQKLKSLKYASSKIHLRRGVKFIVFLLVLTAGINFAIRFSQFRGFFQKTSDFKQTNFSFSKEIDYSYRVNFLILSDRDQRQEFGLLSYQEKEKDLDFFYINKKIYYNLPRVGWSNFGNLYEKEGLDGLAQGVEGSLALPLDGYLEVSEENFDLSESSLSKYVAQGGFIGGLSKIVDAKGIADHANSSLSWKELLSIYFKLAKVNNDNFSYNKLSDFTMDEIRDGTKYLSLDTKRLDNFIVENLSDPALTEEGASVEVQNGTNASGLATLASRFITNLGGRVVLAGNADEKIQETLIYKYSSKPKLISRLKGILPYKLEDKVGENAGSDFLIILGKDFSSSL